MYRTYTIFKQIFRRAKRVLLADIEERLERIQLSLGRIEMRQLIDYEPNKITDVEFQVFSQFGEDGIIQYLIQKVPINKKIFVEIGVENYKESNTRFLLQNNNWAGLVIDSSCDNIEEVKKDPIYWKYNLKAECAFVDAENINSILLKNGISGEIGLLSIDIDGVDFWVWKVIDCISPRIVICEYNSLFGPKAAVTVPYVKDFQRTKAHYSNLYFGASLRALELLGRTKGYSLVASNSAGTNAFFVRNDVLGDLRPLTSEEAYVEIQSRQSRNEKGELTFLNREESLKLIEDMPVYDIEKQKILKIKDVIHD